MAWQQRIENVKAEYMAPDGSTATFAYEDLSESFNKRTSAFEFPDTNGTYVQDMGASARRFPIGAIFWGQDCDTQANEFMDLLRQRGIGKLTHPLYGTFDVVPYGQIRRRDAVKTAANQCIIDLEFWETNRLAYPETKEQAKDKLDVTVADAFASLAAAERETDVEYTVSELTVWRNAHKDWSDYAATKLSSVANLETRVRERFDAIRTSMAEAISGPIDFYLSVEGRVDQAFQVSRLLKEPSRVFRNVQARISAYSSLIRDIIEDVTTDPLNLRVKQTYAFGALSGLLASVGNAQFATADEALETATGLIDTFDAIVSWVSANDPSIDIGTLYQPGQEATATAAGYLVEISFTLKQSRAFTLDRARTVIDLVAELYGGVDEYLDFFITSNSLSGSEILELPRGRLIVYYV